MTLRIAIVSGVGTAPTRIAAFDQALINAGIANYNLLLLSSVIPPGSIIERCRFIAPPADYGHRLFVVLARHDTRIHGEHAWAGLGWVQDPESGKGLLVEVSGTGRRVVERGIERSLEVMVANRHERYGPVHSEIVGIECQSDPVCAIVAAVYASQGWEESP